MIRACSLPPLGVVGWDDPRPKARDRREHPAEVHRVEAPIDHGQAWGTTTATAGLGPGCWWALLYGIKPPGVELWCARASLCGTCAYSLQQHILRALHIQVLPETLVHLRVHQIPGQLPRCTKQSSSTQPPLVCGRGWASLRPPDHHLAAARDHGAPRLVCAIAGGGACFAAVHARGEVVARRFGGDETRRRHCVVAERAAECGQRVVEGLRHHRDHHHYDYNSAGCSNSPPSARALHW